MSHPIDLDRRIGEVVSASYGFDALRPGQLESIRSVGEGRDTLSVMPTGSGKSSIHRCQRGA